eukprot:snap_masked-scaffold_3-processed-gene-20.0-mRNA-1 protein AED:0.35 eAED:0.35 QI:0/-1/0/1/-1/1/1/0/339
MKTITFGNGPAELSVSTISYGAMGLTVVYEEKLVTEEEGLVALRTAFDAGVRHFDTAQAYVRVAPDKSIEHNEVLVGKFLKSLTIEERKEVTVATKFATFSMDMKPFTEFDEVAFFKACDDSLNRLGVDSIDLYYSHRIYPKSVPIETWMNGFVKLFEQGKIKRIGLSEATEEVIRAANAIHPITCIQQEWSLFARDLEKDLVPVCKELNIGIIAYSPVGRGFLAGKFETVKPTGFRSTVPYLNGENAKKNQILLDQIKELAASKGCSANQLCLAWLVYKGAVPIPGSAKPHHIISNCEAADVELTAAEIKKLDYIGDQVSGMRGDAAYMSLTYHAYDS